MGKYFESKTEDRRLKNKTIITICHLRYLEECCYKQNTPIYRIAMRSAWNDRGWSKTMSHVSNSTKIVLTIIDKLSSC